jgi:hypothetical protein
MLNERPNGQYKVSTSTRTQQSNQFNDTTEESQN